MGSTVTTSAKLVGDEPFSNILDGLGPNLGHMISRFTLHLSGSISRLRDT